MWQFAENLPLVRCTVEFWYDRSPTITEAIPLEILRSQIQLPPCDGEVLVKSSRFHGAVGFS